MSSMGWCMSKSIPPLQSCALLEEKVIKVSKHALWSVPFLTFCHTNSKNTTNYICNTSF
jgi:hypothetical protein